MKALITGGAGFIGYHLAKSLAEDRYDVTVLDNLARGVHDDDFKTLLEHPNVSFIKADITDSNALARLDKQYDYVYHLAAINGTENFYNIPDKVIKVGIIGILNILDWFVASRHGKILLSSTSEAYAGALTLLGDKFPIPTPEDVPLVVLDPHNVRWSYGGSKILSEITMHSYAKARHMKRYAIVRYHNIYGPRMGYEHVIPQFLQRILRKQNPFPVYGGEETRAFCYVSDGIQATRAVMEHPHTDGQTVHIGKSDEEINIIDLARRLFDITGYHPSLDLHPAPEGSVKRRCPDITKLKQLGFTPRVNLNKGLAKTYDWYKDKVTPSE